jgi:c-di-GMP-related signal transduction protein
MDIYVARQPIFNKDRLLEGYELLYRSSLVNAFSGIDGDMATSSLISSSLLGMGLENLTQSKRAYINFTRNHILDLTPQAFKPHTLVVEILENIIPDTPIIEKCTLLWSRGYTLALDDFTPDAVERLRPLFQLVDIIKVDCLQTPRHSWADVIQRVNSRRIVFLAEKVETEADFTAAQAAGYRLFQGYFFSKPTIIEGKDVPPGKVARLQLLSEVYKPNPDINDIAKIIERDLSLSYKMLRLINSAAFQRLQTIKSIKQAIVLLGLKELQKWLAIVIVRDVGTDKTEELINLVLVRAKFGELIAPHIQLGYAANEAFLMGLFSCIDVFIGRPIAELMHTLPISPDIKNALTNHDNKIAPILKLAVAYETGDWERFDAIASRVGLNPTVAADCHFQAVGWATSLNQSV